MLSVSERARTHSSEISFEYNGLRVSYQELLEQVNTLATHLGFRPKTRGDCLPLSTPNVSFPYAFDAQNNFETCVLVHALLKAEEKLFPLHPRLTVIERDSLRTLTHARYLYPSDEGWSVAQTDPKERNLTGQVTSARQDPSPTTPQTTLFISTSGSTGTPKIVCLSRRALEASARANAEHLRMSSQDRWLLSLNLAHIGGFSILTRCLFTGAAVVLPPTGLSVEDWVRYVDESQITLLSVVPTQLLRFLELPKLPPLKHLRAILVGGASCPPSLLETARRRGLPTITTYGLSEAASQVTTQPLSEVSNLAPRNDSGIAQGDTVLRIVDGVLELRGKTLFNGYFDPEHPNQPTLPLSSDGFFSTGDFGALTSDGRFKPLGRRTDRIVTGGENVDPVEVENAILKIAEIAEAAVVGLRDPEWGQIVAVAFVRKDGQLECPTHWLEKRKNELRQFLAPYKCPKRWCCVRELPRLPSLKVNRSKVVEFFD